ncbi:pirin family protein [Aquimarina mytili]|uniref:Pirin family protein n=1 Tax=Aquimarina mytili TaxID=874423 RepID=A0A936ZZH5_9FLAO|nr:pirin family protein [Aquimarina mytili]MBL0684750.1 pirin family protein [Aquimarina mytili]
MNTIIHKADSRGKADFGWLQSRHTFSFGNYYNPDRMSFGALRVLNDDTVAGGKGFGAHPHRNMEIISIPLSGDLQHLDSTGRKEIIKQGDVQVMSAGTGIEHSEMNANEDKEVQFLQIWIIPKEENVKPRYDQITLNPKGYKNKFGQILSPNDNDAGVWIHQDAWFYLGEFFESQKIEYSLHSHKSGLYIFLLEGEAKVGGKNLERRDGLGVWDTAKVEIEPSSKAKILLLEVPMI